jgi:hypothetical protein
MDSDFINAYVNRLKNFNNDLINKNILLETQVEIQGKLITELKAQVEQLTQKEEQKLSLPDDQF